MNKVTNSATIPKLATTSPPVRQWIEEKLKHSVAGGEFSAHLSPLECKVLLAELASLRRTIVAAHELLAPLDKAKLA